MDKVRIAIIGAGVMGQKHIRLIDASDQCQLAAICDPDPQRKAEANILGVKFYQSYETMLDQEELDGAIIAAPTGQHVNVGIACAKRAVHILVEKPITATLEEGRQFLEVADQQGVQVLIGHYRRFNPRVQRARTALQNGDLGRLVGISAIWATLKPADYYNVAWRTQPGGGPVLINLIHEMDTLRYLCGEIQSVYAVASSATRGFEVEDSASITLQFENGVVGSITASDAVASPWSYEIATFENPDYAHVAENCYFFLGHNGSLAFPRLELWRYPNPNQMGWQHPLEKIQLSIEQSDPLTDQLAHFCQVIRGEEAPIVSGEDGLRSLAATLAVLESAHQGKPIHLLTNKQ